MVRCWLIALGVCLCGITQAAPSSGLHIQLDRHELEFGQALWLTLSSDQTRVSLDKLDFGAWRQIVALPRELSVNRSPNNTRQVLRLRVYPLRTGKLRLPGLYFMHHVTPAIEFSVTPARDPQTHAPLDFACKVSSHKVWQQQQLVVACRFTLADHYAILSQPQADIPGVQVLPLQTHSGAINTTNRNASRFERGWVLLPKRSGEFAIHLPPIEYVRDGIVIRRYYAPAFPLTVQALPDWLPGNIPVGKLHIDQYRIARTWLTANVLSQLQFQLQVSGVAPSLLPNLAQQLRHDRNLSFYQAQHQARSRIDANGLQHRVTYTVPLVARHMGVYRLPDLRAQYFDPQRGTLESLRLPGPRVIVLSRWLQWLLVILLSGLGIWLAYRLCRRCLAVWRRFRLYQQALRMLAACQTTADIRQVMATMARAEAWPENFSYRQWQARMQTRTPAAANLELMPLYAADYAGHQSDLTPVCKLLLRIGRQRRLAWD